MLFRKNRIATPSWWLAAEQHLRQALEIRTGLPVQFLTLSVKTITQAEVGEIELRNLEVDAYGLVSAVYCYTATSLTIRRPLAQSVVDPDTLSWQVDDVMTISRSNTVRSEDSEKALDAFFKYEQYPDTHNHGHAPLVRVRDRYRRSLHEPDNRLAWYTGHHLGDRKVVEPKPSESTAA